MYSFRGPCFFFSDETLLWIPAKVGFSWERCFDAAVGGLSQGHDGGKHHRGPAAWDF